MKRTLHTILLAGILAASLGLAACSNDAEEAAGPAESASTQPATDTAAQASGDAVPVDVDATTLAVPDVVVEYGDYDAMADLSANIQNARAKGTVVQVDGLVLNYGTSYSIVEPNEDATMRIGAMFVIEGDNATYPQEGQRAKITGVVGSDDTGYSYFIKTLPEFVEVIG